MGFCVLIPARLASTRLPGKPLADIAGQPMVVRVAERARRVVRANVWWSRPTARRSSRPARRHGVEAVLTRADHATGSDRLAEACDLLGLGGDELVVNVQGDEPLIDPALIDAVAGAAGSPARGQHEHGRPRDRRARRIRRTRTW